MLLAGEIAEAKRILTRSLDGIGTCVITRPDPDDERSIDTESGQLIGDAPAAIEVYNGDCWVDERGEVVAREQGGDTDVDGKGVVILPAEAAVFDIETDDVEVTFSGVTRSAQILNVMHLLTQVRLLVTWTARAEAA